MWPARAALRPVPRHAVVPENVVEELENEFVGAEHLASRIDRAFDDLDEQQPALSHFLSAQLDGVTDETAQALGHFLGIVVHKAYRNAFGRRLRSVHEDTIASTAASFDCDEELRRGSGDEVLETDDVVAMAQPHLVTFVRSQLDAALEADVEGEPSDVELDAVSHVYRAVLVEIMALAQSVDPPNGTAASNVMMS